MRSIPVWIYIDCEFPENLKKKTFYGIFHCEQYALLFNKLYLLFPEQMVQMLKKNLNWLCHKLTN